MGVGGKGECNKSKGSMVNHTCRVGFAMCCDTLV